MTRDAAAPEWPITVITRWTDLGYSAFEARAGLALAAALLWMTGVFLALEGHLYRWFLVVPLLIGAWLAWRWVRRRPAEVDLVIEPERLRIRDGVGAAWTELRRGDAGQLLAAETGLDWNDRLIVLGDSFGREVLRSRARFCVVRFPDSVSASEAWWRATMPAGSTREQPPTTLPVTPLLGSWWPDPAARHSVRGNLGVRSAWREPDLVQYPSWNRRQRRLNSLILVATLVFVYGITIAITRPLTLTEWVAFLPPAAIAIAVAARAAWR